MTLNDSLNYGVQFFLQGAIKNASNNTVPISGSQLTVPLPLAQAIPEDHFVVGSLANPSVVITALRDVTDVKVPICAITRCRKQSTRVAASWRSSASDNRHCDQRRYLAIGHRQQRELC